MVAFLLPFGIAIGATAAAFFIFFSFWGSVNTKATARVNSLAFQLDRAGIRMSSQEIVLTIAAGIAVVWIGLVVLMHPTPLIAAIILPLIAGVAALSFYAFVQFRIRKRLFAFTEQLEVALRLIASSIRVGLGLRQALAIVIDELPDPCRYEFSRVIGQTNIGLSVYDAMDDLAVRMPNNETLMVARVFRVQSETGGDLSKILDQLAETIKDRRQIQRKISSLTAEGRMSAWVLLLIPIGLGLFIFMTQANMAHALFYTAIGHIVLLVISGLELFGYFWVTKLLQVEV